MPSPYDAAPDTTGPETGRTRLRGAFLIPCDRIRTDPNQVRRTVHPESIEELARSIMEVGILQPIAVRYDPTEELYVIIAGERRYLAARHAGLKEVPCIVREPGQDQVLLHQISENWQREDVDPVELGRALAGLQEAYQYTLNDLVRLTGKSKADISKQLAIAGRIEPTIQAAAQRDPKVLTKRHLYSISKLDPSQQSAVAAAIQKRRMSAQATERLVEEKRLERAGVKRPSSRVTVRRFNTHHGTVTVRTKRGQAGDDHILAALKEAAKQLLDDRQ